MNEFIASMILAFVQGIAEWLPISSSAHLVIVSRILNYPSSLELSVALHFGTLMAVVVYFSKDIVYIIRDLMQLKFKTEEGKTGLMLALAAIPAAIVGFFAHKFLETSLENTWFMILGLAITSITLFISSMPVKLGDDKMTYKKSLIIGLAQIASLFRGISRSGSTISTALLLGIPMKSAVRFSFLLSIPIVLGANMLLIGGEQLPPAMLIPMFFAFIVGISSIHLSFKYILNKRSNLKWIGLYVLIIALALSIWEIAY